jgi:metallo-beta-lactamase superfamily protein
MTLTTRPAPDELEVSVFGPGLGESIAAHVGDDEWIVVDSCKDPDTGRPASLQYLEVLGIDIGSRVKLVVVTHWHDDHMRGAAEILRAATQAQFCCSIALRCDEFWTLLAGSEQLVMKSDSATGVAEFASILETLKQRRPRHTPPASAGPRWAMADMLLYRRNGAPGSSGCEVHALSPSSTATTRAFRGLAQLVPQLRGARRAAVAVGPNEASVVLSVSLGDAHALLGADLETGANLASGWHAVVTSATRPSTKAGVYKVAHHGSANADHDAIWSALVADEPVAVLTPFLQGNVVLPSSPDLARLRARTPRCYTAGRPRPAPAVSRDRAVERTIREVATTLRPRYGRIGHVRVRLGGAAGRPRVETFGAASPL